MRRFSLLLIVLTMSVWLVAPAGANVGSKRKVTIGMIGKIAVNPVFVAARAGAQKAATELGEHYGVEIEIEWQTPIEENVTIQASTIDRMAASNIDGIAIACSDATILTPTIDKAVAKGVPILCFDSDAPKSKRFAYCGADDREFGKLLGREIAKALNQKGKIGILAGNKNALNQQRRLQSLKDELKKTPGITVAADNIYNNPESPEPAMELIKKVYAENPNINGWVFQGSWTLLLKNALPWQPGSTKAVAGNAVPAELEYVKSGHVQSLVGVNCYLIGYQSVEILLKKIMKNELPPTPNQFIPLTTVTKDNVEEWSSNWTQWLAKEGANR